jgi:hypothetical protein
MVTQLSEGEWIDRFASEIGRLGAGIEPEILMDIGREIWPFVGEIRPEAVARAEWDAAWEAQSE